MTVDAKIVSSGKFFGNLDIGAFKIRDEKLAFLMNSMLKETLQHEDGRERMCKILCDAIAIEVIRYILRKRLFVEQLATNSTYFKDPRLINIFTYIREHIGDDLSNKRLAEVAEVSEDYVGQYFKMLTGITPQDYNVYPSMEYAVNLIRSSKIGEKEKGEVGNQPEFLPMTG